MNQEFTIAMIGSSSVAASPHLQFSLTASLDGVGAVSGELIRPAYVSAVTLPGLGTLDAHMFGSTFPLSASLNGVGTLSFDSIKQASANLVAHGSIWPDIGVKLSFGPVTLSGVGSISATLS